MSYRVQYDSNMKWEAEKKSWGVRRLWMIGLCFLLFVGMVFHFWKDGAQVLLQLLLPGDAAMTWLAMEQLTQNLYQGMPLPVAAQEFCYGIIQAVY